MDDVAMDTMIDDFEVRLTILQGGLVTAWFKVVADTKIMMEGSI